MLLILFMLTVPWTMSEPATALPGQFQLARAEDSVVVSVGRGGVLRVGEQVVSLGKLGIALREAAKDNLDQRVTVRIDGSGVKRSDLAPVLDAIRSEGFTKLAIVGEEVLE